VRKFRRFVSIVSRWGAPALIDWWISRWKLGRGSGAGILATVETTIGKTPRCPCMVAAQSHDDWTGMDGQRGIEGDQRLSLR
jgi:hypothetical protein